MKVAEHGSYKLCCSRVAASRKKPRIAYRARSAPGNAGRGGRGESVEMGGAAHPLECLGYYAEMLGNATLSENASSMQILTKAPCGDSSGRKEGPRERWQRHAGMEGRSRHAILGWICRGRSLFYLALKAIHL